MTIIIHGYFPSQETTQALAAKEASPVMWVPMACFALLSVLIGMFPGWLIAFIRSIASGIL